MTLLDHPPTSADVFRRGRSNWVQSGQSAMRIPGMRTFLITLVLLVSPTLAAASSGYASLSYVFASVEPKDADSSADVNAVQFSFGSWLNPDSTFGVEGRIGLGFGEDSARFPDADNRDVEINRYFGGYARAQFPDTLPVRPYGLLGVTRVETTERLPDRSRSENYNDFSLGFGFDVTLDHNIYANLEFLRAVDRGTRQISFLSLGLGGRF